MAIEDGLRRLLLLAGQPRCQLRDAIYLVDDWQPGANCFHFIFVITLENHGHTVIDDATRDVFQPVVKRGLNYILNNLNQIPLSVQHGNDPCVGVPE